MSTTTNTATAAEVQAVITELTAHYNRDLEWAEDILANDDQSPVTFFVCVNADYTMALHHDFANACFRLASDPAAAELFSSRRVAEQHMNLWNRHCQSEYTDDRSRLPMVRMMTRQAFAAQVRHNCLTQLEFLNEAVLPQ